MMPVVTGIHISITRLSLRGESEMKEVTPDIHLNTDSTTSSPA